MSLDGRSMKALTQLARVARQKEDEQAALLADLRAAHQSAQTSIDWLAQTVEKERVATQSAGDAAAIHAFAAYGDASEKKRQSLVATRDRLEEEMQSVKDALQACYRERVKFERLVESMMEKARRRDRRRSNAVLDDVAGQSIVR